MHPTPTSPIQRTTNPAADRLLLELKMRGPQSSAVLGSLLGITGEAVRQQLLRLEDQGLVESRAMIRGVGRPMAMWHLMPAAEARFPDAHAQVTVDLLNAIRQELGDAAIDTVISRRERETTRGYRIAMEGTNSIGERVQRLAELRAAEGYMAEIQDLGDITFRLIENHCPICAAATACQEFCRAELQVFREVLGPEVTVSREEHIMLGARRCSYRIAPAND